MNSHDTAWLPRGIDGALCLGKTAILGADDHAITVAALPHVTLNSLNHAMEKTRSWETGVKIRKRYPVLDFAFHLSSKLAYFLLMLLVTIT